MLFSFATKKSLIFSATLISVRTGHKLDGQIFTPSNDSPPLKSVRVRKNKTRKRGNKWVTMRVRTEEKRVKVPSKMTQRERERARRMKERTVLFFSPPSITEFNFLFFMCHRNPHMFMVLSGKDKAWERKQSAIAWGHSLFHLPNPSPHLCPHYFRFYCHWCAVHQLSRQPVRR